MKRLNRKIVSFVLVAVMVVGLGSGIFNFSMEAQAGEIKRPETTGILGDANGDGKLSCSDWVRVQAELAESDKLASKDALFSNGRAVEETDAEIVRQLLMYDTSAISEETVLAYGTSFGKEQVTPKWNDGRAVAEYTTDRAYEGENGSLKITQLVQSENYYGKEIMFQFKESLQTPRNGYKDTSYLKFYVWYESAKVVKDMSIMLTHAEGSDFGWGKDILEDTAVNLVQNQWTEVWLPLKDVNSLNDYGVIMFADWQNFEGDTFYFSNASVVEIDNNGIVYGFGNGTSTLDNPMNYANSAEYTTEMSYGTDSGSLKVSNNGNPCECIFSLPKELTTLSGTEVLEMYIYYAPAEGNSLGNMNIYLTEDMWGESHKITLNKNEWTKVIIDMNQYQVNTAEGLYLKLMSSDWRGCVGDVWYFSSARLECIGEDTVYALSNSTEGAKSFVNSGQVSYSTEIKYGDEAGSTQIYFAEAGKEVKPYFTNEKRSLSGAETVEFYIYYSGTDTKHLNLYGLKNGKTVFLKYVEDINKDGWTKVSCYLQGCTSLSYLLIQNGSWTSTSAEGDTFYISDVKIVEESTPVYDYGNAISTLDTCGYITDIGYSTQKVYGRDDGSRKLTNRGNSNEVLLSFQGQLPELSGTEILEMYVYYAPAETNRLDDMYFYLSEGAYDKDGATPALITTELKKNEWTKVTIDLTQISKKNLDGLYIKLMSNTWGGCVGDKWYFSSVRVAEHCQYTLETGLWSELLQEGGGQHAQGIAYDDENKYMYVSYTRLVVKVDIQTGEIVGCVKGFSESSVMKDIHLGDMTYYDGKLYEACKVNNRFYIAVFDCDKINGDVHYQDEGVMKALYLSQLTENTTTKLYNTTSTVTGAGSRYWWTGSDGLTFGKLPGGGYDTDGDGKVDVKDNKTYIFHTNGGYKNPSVYDNENYFMQVFDPADINETNLLPFTDARVKATVTKSEEYHYKFKTFVYVGNSDYGVQTLTYDKDTGDFWMETYGKPAGTEFPKYGRYVIDGSVPLYMAEVEVGQSVTGDAEGFITQEEAHRVAAYYKDFEDGDGDGDYEEQEQGWHMTLKCLCSKGSLKNHEAVVYGATGHACKICGAQATFSCGIVYAGNGYFYGATNYIKEGIGGLNYHGLSVNLYKWNASKKKLELMYFLIPTEE